MSIGGQSLSGLPELRPFAVEFPAITSEGLMENRIARLESRIAYLNEHVSDLEQRLAVIEGRAPRPADESRDTEILGAIAGLERAPVQQWLGLAGRTLVVLGGAYLLRALTGSHVLSAQAGVGLGILYGAPWLLLASRAWYSIMRSARSG